MAAIPGAAGPGAGYPQWTYNTTTGAIDKVGNPVAKGIAESVSWPAELIFFTSDQAARSYAATTNIGGADLSASPGAGTVQNATNSATQPAANALSGFGTTGGAIRGALQILADGTMWRSLGWLLLGIALMVSGVALWLRQSAGELVAGAMFPEAT